MHFCGFCACFSHLRDYSSVICFCYCAIDKVLFYSQIIKKMFSKNCFPIVLLEKAVRQCDFFFLDSDLVGHTRSDINFFFTQPAINSLHVYVPTTQVTAEDVFSFFLVKNLRAFSFAVVTAVWSNFTGSDFLTAT